MKRRRRNRPFSVIPAQFSSIQTEPLEQRLLLAVTVGSSGSINRTEPWEEMQEFTTVYNRVYFVASDPGSDTRDLWVTDGEPRYTRKLVSLGPKTNASHHLTNVGGVLYFRGYDETHGRELWRSDGSPQGTSLVRDLKAGAADSALSDLVSFNGMLLFSANGHLCRSDGTRNGTVLVKDLVPSLNDNAGELTLAGNVVVFKARNAQGSVSLYRTNGTNAGTQLFVGTSHDQISDLTEISGDLFFVGRRGSLWKVDPDRPSSGAELIRGSTSISLSPSHLTNVSGMLFFASGGSLWKSTGAASGTTLVRQVGAKVTNLFNMNGQLFFAGGTTASDVGYELWKSDGSSVGTVLVKDIDPRVSIPDRYGFSSDPKDFLNFNGTLIFHAAGGLWKTDGTEAGTIQIEHRTATSPVVMQNTLYFVRLNSSQPAQLLWKRHSLESPSVLVVRPGAGRGDGDPKWLTPYGPWMFLVANDGFSDEGIFLWSMPTGWRSPEKFSMSPEPVGTGFSHLFRFKELLFFVLTSPAGATELWTTTGSGAAQRLGSFDGLRVSSASNTMFTPVGDSLFFTAISNEGLELWKTDGTLSGTSIVRDIFPGTTEDDFGASIPQSAVPNGLINLNGRLFFSATTAETGRELWTSDGTTAGTVLVKDLWPGFAAPNSDVPRSSEPESFAVHQGSLFFAAAGPNGRGLWKSDGTSDGTVFVSGGDSGLSSVDQLFSLRDKLYFAGTSPEHGEELWVSDGTAAGTRLVRDIRQGSQSASLRSFTSANGLLYFVADDGVHGAELWQSDGTSAGTRLVRDINTGVNPSDSLPRGSEPAELVNVNGVLFFTADDGQQGREVWRTLGTSPGAFRVSNFPDSANGSEPWHLTMFDGRLHFSASTLRGRELHFATSRAPYISDQAEPVVWQEKSSAVRIGPAIVVSDDDTPVFRGGQLFVRQINVAPGDQIRIVPDSDISVTQNRISFRNVVIGTVQVSDAATRLRVFLNHNATHLSVQTLMRAVRFSNSSLNPVVSERRFEFELLDGDSSQKISGRYRVRVIAVNDRPVITGLPQSVSYASLSLPGLRVAATAVVTDPDNAHFGGGRLRVVLSGTASLFSRIALTDPIWQTDEAGNVSYRGLLIGQMNSGGGRDQTPLEITFNSSARASIVQALIRSLRFSSTGAAVTARQRVTFTLTDSSLATSSAASVIVNLND